jgi:hypothetical protein
LFFFEITTAATMRYSGGDGGFIDGGRSQAMANPMDGRRLTLDADIW